jgi:hypothetical protein
MQCHIWKQNHFEERRKPKWNKRRVLQGPSHKIRFTQKRYEWLGLSGEIDAELSNLYHFPLFLNLPWISANQSIRLTSLFFYGRLIEASPPPFLFFSLVAYWLGVLLQYSRDSKVAGEAPGWTGRRLLSPFSVHISRRNPPTLVWRNSCTSGLVLRVLQLKIGKCVI